MTSKRSSFDGPRGDERAPKVAPRTDPELVADLGALLDAEHMAGHGASAELDAARDEAARNLASAQKWQAEFENYRRRQERDLADMRVRAGERIVTELIPVLDDLDRAIAHTLASAASGGELEHLLSGVEMVRSRILAVFAKEGVETIDPLGTEFDPHLHQAVGQRDDPEAPEHTVVEVFQKGYLMGGRVVRPAMVIVSSGGPSPSS
jgi:molecular chaperone GrpE